MLTITFLPHLKQHLRVAKLISSLPFQWDDSSGKLSLLPSKIMQFIVTSQLMLQTVYSILQVVMTTFSPYSTGTKFQAMVFTSINLTGLLLRWNWKLDKTAMNLLNAFIKFEESFLKGIRPYQSKSRVFRILFIRSSIYFLNMFRARLQEDYSGQINVTGSPVDNFLMFLCWDLYWCGPLLQAMSSPICWVDATLLSTWSGKILHLFANWLSHF